MTVQNSQGKTPLSGASLVSSARRRNLKFKSVLIGCSSFVAVLGGPAYAQEEQSAPVETKRSLDVITVTAQKREETLQEVPISISAVDGAVIEDRSVDDLISLSASVPNVFISESQIDTAIGIRGISTGNNKGFEQSVGMYVDGISFGRSQLIRMPLVDLERVEVLRGPQPTLFGKNAIAGAVNVITAKPTSEFEGKIGVSYEFEHEEPQILGVVSGPINDNWGYRLVGSYRELDGYITNETLGRKEPNKEEKFLRGQLAYDDGNALDVNLKLEWAQFDILGRALEVNTPIGSFNTVFSGPLFVETDENYQSEGDSSRSSNEVFDAVLTANYALGNHTLTSITGFAQYETVEGIDIDYTRLKMLYADQTEDYTQFSQELRLTSPGNQRIDYVAGLYYQNSELEVTDDIAFQSLFSALGAPFSLIADSRFGRQYDQEAELFSAFAQADFNFTDQLTLTAGARLSSEEKDASRAMFVSKGPTNMSPLPVVQAVLRAFNIADHDLSGSRSEDAFDPLVRLLYKPTDFASLYVSYTEGSKAGGFDVRGSSSPSDTSVAVPGTFEYEDEGAKNYEIGAKFAWDTAELNVTAYKTEYTNLQTNVFDGVLGFLVENASEAETSGVEFDGRMLVGNNFTLYGSGAYLDFEYANFPGGQCAFGQVPDNGILCDYAGRRAAFAPEWSANYGVDYERDLGRNLIFDANLNFDYSSEYELTTNLDSNQIQDAYTKVGAQIGLSSAEGRWRVSLIGDNLTDERIRTLSSTVPLTGTITRGTGVVYDSFYMRPRNVTLKLEYKF